MRIAVAQVEITKDRELARAILRDSADWARDAEARLLVLPEYASGFDPGGADPNLAEPAGGPYECLMRELSEQYELCVIAGVLRTNPQAGLAPTNTLVVADGGEIITTYNKVHLFDAFDSKESDRLSAGDPAQTGLFNCDQFTIGLQTCYDLRFPEITRTRSAGGAQIVVNPAAWAAGPNKLAQWRTLLAARAIENTCVMVGAAMTGRGVVGHSTVVMADGTVRAELRDERSILVADVDLTDIELTRTRNPSLKNRRM